MSSLKRLAEQLKQLDGKGYGAYKSLKGTYVGDSYTFSLEQVQSDPFAPPSTFSLTLPLAFLGYPSYLYSSPERDVAFRDYLVRMFAGELRRHARCPLTIDTPDQEILDQNAVVFHQEALILRGHLHLPAFGRRIAGKQAAWIVESLLPRVIEHALYWSSLDEDAVMRHICTYEDAASIRRELASRNLLSFVANDSILPRKSGVSTQPMSSADAISFQAPESLQVTIHRPNLGPITGMGIPKGVTVLVGGGYHGKSTLLRAVELGVYNHVPGDGREFVVSDPDAVKVRAEDGRNIVDVGISPFITNLPGGKSTDHFSSENASGSTSQAANIMEMLEMGASALLIDEDTSATNFMIRDELMQRLIHKNKEPITPFVDKVRQVYEDLGVSVLLVMGGSGDYLWAADTIIGLEDHRVYDKTEETKTLLSSHSVRRRAEGGEQFGTIRTRLIEPSSIETRKGNKEKVQAKHTRLLLCGTQEIDLTAVEQLVDTSQTRAIAAVLRELRHQRECCTLSEVLKRYEEQWQQQGIASLGRTGTFATVRRFELAAAINRLRSLRIRQAKQ